MSLTEDDKNEIKFMICKTIFDIELHKYYNKRNQSLKSLNEDNVFFLFILGLSIGVLIGVVLMLINFRWF